MAHGMVLMPESEPFGHNLAIRSIEDLHTRYYIRLTVKDEPGTLTKSTAVFSENNISISHISQYEIGGQTDACTLIFLTHTALERDMQNAREALEALDSIKEVSSVIRVEDIDAWSEGVFAN